MRLRWGPQRAMLEWGEEEMRSAKKSLTREESFVSEAISDDCAAKLLLFSDMAMACPLTCGAVAP